jgi:putative membrane protein
MKKAFCLLVIASGLFVLSSCGSGSSNQDSVDSAKDANDAKDTSSVMNSDDTTNMNATSTMPVDKDAADFAVEAASGGMMEVELGKLAQEKAASQRVKDFGAMMVKAHSAAGDKLKAIASAKNITLPAEMGDKQKKDMEDLSKKSGKDFDKAYMDMMLDDHKKDVKKFEDAADKCKDPDLKTFASATLPTLRMHLDSAKAITGKK